MTASIVAQARPGGDPRGRRRFIKPKKHLTAENAENTEKQQFHNLLTCHLGDVGFLFLPFSAFFLGARGVFAVQNAF
jgi:hypothetical protein